MDKKLRTVLMGCLGMLCLLLEHPNSFALQMTDTSRVATRQFNATSLSHYSQDEDFQYELSVQEMQNPWEDFKMWLLQKLFSLKLVRILGQWIDYVLYGIALAAFLYLIWRLLGTQNGWLFYGKGTVSNVMDGPPVENIHVLDFKSLIAQAIQSKNFREAIRLYYLFTLKQLSDRNRIVWEPFKTNADYISEYGRIQSGSQFGKLAYIYEYAWYGEFDLDENTFHQAQQSFLEFQQSISHEKR
jgi:hypothetical protein